MNAFLLAYLCPYFSTYSAKCKASIQENYVGSYDTLGKSGTKHKTQKGIARAQFEFFDFSGSSLERGRVVSPPGRLKYLPGRRYHHVVHVATPVRFLGDGNSREFDVQLRRGRT